ncbi:DUF2177 family protein, partial [Acidocella sp.]|uniref:DUF2177 family protein n=1 Tax=Acidocella sp. TaxID=50710 RepID=UPI0026256ED4
MKSYLTAYIAAGISFTAVDALWLSLMSARLYRPALQGILAERVQVAPAIAFYALYILGLVIFAVAPGLAAGRWSAALWRGALFGLFTYMTYDLTNQATLRAWPFSVTAADLSWGML